MSKIESKKWVARSARGALILSEERVTKKKKRLSMKELRAENAELSNLVSRMSDRAEQANRMLGEVAKTRDVLIARLDEQKLTNQAERRCNPVMVSAQVAHRSMIYKELIETTKKLIVAERRITELEAEVACFKSVRVAS